MLEPIRYAEFCTGVGGFRLGIEASGIKAVPVYANEIDDNCEKTYRKNFGIGFDSKDIFEINPYNIPDFDMLCAGFPCQPFSVAGKELGFKDSRGTVFFRILSVIETKKPQIVFLENVPNLVRHDKGRTFRVITEKLIDAGYSISSAILDSSYFGIPQSRSRIYIVGLRKDIYGERYDYSKVAYKNSEHRVVVICPIHGDFQLYAREHLDGKGCPKCEKG